MGKWLRGRTRGLTGKSRALDRGVMCCRLSQCQQRRKNDVECRLTADSTLLDVSFSFAASIFTAILLHFNLFSLQPFFSNFSFFHFNLREIKRFILYLLKLVLFPNAT